MTNAVDVLLVDGPAHGRVVCFNKPLATNIETSNSTLNGTVMYLRREFVSAHDSKKYHVAQIVGGVTSPANITALILLANFQPAWDLN